MVEPQGMSLRTQNSCTGIPWRRPTSLRLCVWAASVLGLCGLLRRPCSSNASLH